MCVKACAWVPRFIMLGVIRLLEGKSLRSDSRSKSIPALAERLEDMATIVEHKRSKGTDATGSNRRVR
ncbi:MAG TPA: hypothetical protein VE174_05320, partial [Actinomycetota bacterium]|nr:hypothetical protein [Actinomycetota bacterium]